MLRGLLASLVGHGLLAAIVVLVLVRSERPAARVEFRVEGVERPRAQPQPLPQQPPPEPQPEARPRAQPRPARGARPPAAAPAAPPAADAEADAVAAPVGGAGPAAPAESAPDPPPAAAGVGGHIARGPDSTAPPDPAAIHAAIAAAIRYPRLARSQGLEGRVVVRFRIDPAGAPLEISILTSSGALLDAAARDAIERAAPFHSPPGWVRVPVDFSLHDAP